MPITVNHSTPADGTFSATGATAWDANHTLSGVGTMAEQNANAVAITGGTINGTTIGATTQADITGNTINAFTKFVSPDYYAQSVLGGNLRTSGGTSLVNWDGGGSGNVTVNGGLLANPSNKNVSLAPTGTGSVTVNPDTAGTINNMSIGSTTPAAGTFTTITGQTEVLKGTGTNLFLQSNTFTNASWTQTAVTPATTVATTDPFGGTNAYTLTEDSSTNPHRIFQPVTTVNQSYVISCYFKANTRNWALLRTTNSAGTAINAYFNVSTGVLGTVDSGLTGTITSVGNGWYRCSIVLANAFVGVNNTTVGMSSADNTLSYAGNGTSSIYIYGSQFEVGSLISPYQATTTTAIYGTPTLSFSGVAGLGLQSDGSLYVSPAGTGALQAQATTSSIVGGNARGANAVDWQMSRATAAQVASGANAFIGGGRGNTASGQDAIVGSGYQNIASGGGQATIAGGAFNQATAPATFIGGGGSNIVPRDYSSIVGGNGNGSSSTIGYFNFIGGGQSNSGTATAAVTTQSGTMNGTTAVTLSGSNANIKVGQLVTGTYITFPTTYVAAISGTSLTLSTVASGSGTATLSFFTPHGVVVGGGNNQATGSYSFIGGGGDAGTAANRNVASGDWSFVGGGIRNQATAYGATVCGGADPFFGGANLASGQASAVLGGAQNTASGYQSTVLGGTANIASGGQSRASGLYANTRAIVGAFANGYNGFSSFSAGTCQYVTYLLQAGTTDATPKVATADGTAASTVNQVILPNNSAYYFTGEVVSGVTGGGNSKGWEISGLIKRGANAGATTLVGSTVTSLYADAGAATWTIGLTADTTNGGLTVTFTGQASTTIRTVCQIRTTEMTY